MVAEVLASGAPAAEYQKQQHVVFSLSSWVLVDGEDTTDASTCASCPVDDWTLVGSPATHPFLPTSLYLKNAVIICLFPLTVFVLF